MAEKVYITDSTLRNAELVPACFLSTEEKLRIIYSLEELNVDAIDCGLPVTNEVQAKAGRELVRHIRKATACISSRAIPEEIKHAAFALDAAEKGRLQLGITAGWNFPDFQAKEQFIELLILAIRNAQQYTNEVAIYIEEALKADFSFLVELLNCIQEEGVRLVTLADSSGSCLPLEFTKIFQELSNHSSPISPLNLSVHCHNEMGLATANTLSALHEGVRHIDCSINGIGYRAGFTSLEEITMILNEHPELSLYTDIQTRHLYKCSQIVAATCNMPVQANKAIVGLNAHMPSSTIFHHALMNEKTLLEGIDAEEIGYTDSSILLTVRSDRNALNQRIQKIGVSLTDSEIDEVYEIFKQRARELKIVNDIELKALLSEYLMSHLNF